MVLTLDIPDSTVLDWEYITNNLDTLMADKSVKTEAQIALQALQQFNTPLLKDKMS